MNQLVQDLRACAAYARWHGYLADRRGNPGGSGCALGIIDNIVAHGSLVFYEADRLYSAVGADDCARADAIVEALDAQPEIHTTARYTNRLTGQDCLTTNPANRVAAWNNALRDTPNATEIVASMFDRCADQIEQREAAESFMAKIKAKLLKVAEAA